MSFAKYNPAINKYMQESPDNMIDGIMMVVLSIQQRWSTIGVQMESWRAEGPASRFVWGNKTRSAEWLVENGPALFDRLRFHHMGEDHDLVREFLAVPGLGLPKAGFAAQLMFGRVGCIDVHNLRRLNIPESVLKLSKKATKETQERRIREYTDALKLRRSEWLWNTWCNLIAKKYPNDFIDSNAVSRLHLTALTGDANVE